MVYTTPTKKARIVLLRCQGKKFSEIANQFNIHRSTASGIFNKYNKTEDYYHVGSKTGRPRLMGHHDRVLAVQKIRSGQARDGADLCRQKFPHLSYSTVRKELREMGLHGRRCRTKFFLMKYHVKKRVEWAEEHAEWGPKDWERVVFSDESKFCLFGLDGVQYCRRGPGEEYKPQNVAARVKHGGGSIMVWECITSKEVGRLYRIKGAMTGEYCGRAGTQPF